MPGRVRWPAWSVQVAPPSVVRSSSPKPVCVICSPTRSHPLFASVNDTDVVTQASGEMVSGPSGMLALVQPWVVAERRSKVTVVLQAFGATATHWWPSGCTTMPADCSCACLRPGGVMLRQVAPRLSVHNNACCVRTYPCPPANSAASDTWGPARGCCPAADVAVGDDVGGGGDVTGDRDRWLTGSP